MSGTLGFLGHTICHSLPPAPPSNIQDGSSSLGMATRIVSDARKHLELRPQAGRGAGQTPTALSPGREKASPVQLLAAALIPPSMWGHFQAEMVLLESKR